MVARVVAADPALEWVEPVEGGSILHDRFQKPHAKQPPEVMDQLKQMFDMSHPIESALLDQLLLPALVVIGMAKNELKWEPLNTANARAAVTSPKSSDTNETVDRLGFHGPDEHTSCV